MLNVEHLRLAAGEFRIEDVSFAVDDGEYFVLMGSTGSGKSLVLKAICGIAPITGGRVLIDGEDVTLAEPRLRKVGYVPQNSDLFPHLNVERNLTFPCEADGMRLAEARREIGRIVDVLGIAALLARSGVTHLVGGHMGEGAFRVLQGQGIKVIRGASGPAKAAAESFAAGRFSDSGDGCVGHGEAGHDCAH